MSLTEFSKKILMRFFIIVTGINVAIAVLGLSLYPKQTLSYDAFFSPIIFGAAAVLPAYVLYSKKELTFRQMLMRRIVHFVLLEMLQIGFGYLTGYMNSFRNIAMLFLAVLAVYLFTSVIAWIIDSRTAVEINKGLQRLQKQ